MSQVKKYQDGGLYDDVTSRQEANQIRRAANKAERMYRRGQRKAMRQYYNPNEARQARINKLADKIEQQQEIAGIKQGMDEYKDLSAYQDQIETNGPGQNPGDTYGGFMRRPGTDYTEQGGGDYFNTQQPHPGSNFIIWNGQKVLWNDFQREQMQKYLNTLDPEDRQFLAGVVDALNDGYDVEYDTNRMALNMPDQYYYVRGKNTVDRLKNEQSRVGAVLGGMFNTKMANYRDSIAQLSRYGLGLQDMDFSEITGLPGEDATTKAWGEGWEANPNYTKMMKRINDIEAYLKDPETARQVYNELPDDKKWLLEKTYNDPKFYEDLRKAMIDGTLISAQREFLKQIGIVSEGAKPAEGPGDDSDDDGDDGVDSDNEGDDIDTITDALQKMGITTGDGNAFYTHEVLDDGTVQWNIGDAWNDKSKYAALNIYSGYEWGDTYSGGIMMNFNDKGWLVSNKALNDYLLNDDHIDQTTGLFKFTAEDLNGIQDANLKQEMTTLVNKYNTDAKFKDLVNDTIKQIKTDAQLRREQNQWTDYYTRNDQVTDKVEYLKPNSGDTFIGGLHNYGRTLKGEGGVQAITRRNNNENEYEAVEAITDMLRSNGTLQIPKKNPDGSVQTDADGKPVMIDATSADWQDLSNFVEHGTDEVVMGFYDPNDINAYDNMGYAIPSKAKAIYKYNTKTRQISKVNNEDVDMKGNFGAGKYNNMGFLTPTEGGKEQIESKRNGHIFKAVKKLQGANNALYIGVDTSSNDHSLWVWDNNLKSPRRIFNTELLQRVLNATTDEALNILANDPDNINIDSWTKGASGTIWENKFATIAFDPTLDWNQLTNEVTPDSLKEWTENIYIDVDRLIGRNKKYNSDLYTLLKWYADQSGLVAEKHGGKLPKFQYGGAISSSGKEDIITTQQDIVGVADPETFHKSINNFNKLSQSDKIALISTLGDVASTLGSLVPGLNLISAGVGLGSSVGHLVADIQRDGSDAKDWGNFAANVGLDLLSAIPIAGAAAKTAKAARGIKSISAIITPILMGLGAYSAAGAITKLITDGWKSLSNEEVAQLAGGVSMLRNVLKGGRAAIDRAKVARDINAGKSEVDLSKGIKLKSKTGQEVEITTSDGSITLKLSELDISKETAEQLAKATDGISRRKIIENEFKKKLGNDWDKLTPKEKNEFMSKFQSATEGVDISMPVTARQGGLRTKFSPNGQQAIVRIASPTDISAKKAFRQGLFNPSKVSLEKVGQHFTTKLESDVSKLPAYMQRYIKNEFAKASTQPFIGMGSRYHGGNPENRLWIDRNWFTRNLFFPITRRAQGNLDNLPFTISYDKANWWRGWGPNRYYNIVSNDSRINSGTKKVIETKGEKFSYMPIASRLSDGHPNLTTDRIIRARKFSGEQPNSLNIYSNTGSIRTDLKLTDLPDDIKIIKPKYLKGKLRNVNGQLVSGGNSNLTIEQAVKNLVDKGVDEGIAIRDILGNYIMFGKSGMKIPKYQEAWAPIPTIEDTNNQWIWSSPNSETLINGEEITDTNANDLNNVTRAPGTVVPFNYDQWLQRSLKPDLPTELLPRQTETITGRKIKRKREPKRDGAGKGAFMENVNWGNLLDKEWLAKSANLIQNLGSARKLYENQKDAINEQAKYRIPNINERYTQFFDDGATSNFMQQAAASRSAISNMAGSDSRANMAMALANEQRIGQEQNNLNLHNAQRYAEWQNTNNREHAEYDKARYDTFLQNQRRDADLSRALHQAKDNYINQKQQLWNNFGADVITRIQQEESNKDNAYDTNIYNMLNKQAIAAIKAEFPEYNTKDFKPTVEQQQRIQEILNERDAVYSAYTHNNRSVFNKMDINKPSWLDESSMNVFKSGGKLSEKDKERIKIDKETAKRFHDLLKLQIRENVKADKEYRKMLNQL